jgi:hypothetical protein
MIRSVMLKGLKSRTIHIELESVYEPESLALRTVQERGRRFHQRRPDLFGDPRSGKPLTNYVAGAIGLYA